MAIVNPTPRVAEATFGRGLLDVLPRALFDHPIVLSQPEPWALVRDRFADRPVHLHLVESMDHLHVHATTQHLGPGSAVFGVGGGSAVDFAKYVAWKKGLPLVIVPTVLSVDAAFTKAIGVRDDGRVRYVGEVFPDHLLIDFDLLQAAPPELNRAGVGDVISIFTALWDWREAGERLGEPYDAGVAESSRRLLERFLEGAAEIRDQTEAGLRLLAEAYVEEVRLCEMVGSARPEEGSEHAIAYCLESLTGGHYLHGQLVGLCVLIAGQAQGQDVRPIARFLRAVGLQCRPEAVGTSREELLRALLHMGTYIEEETQLLPGVFHFRGGVERSEAERILDRLDELT